MSSTGRGADRSKNDFYRTPAWCVTALLKHLALADIQVIVDPGCGDGAIGDALFGHERLAGVESIGIELDGRHFETLRRNNVYSTVHQMDFLEWAPRPHELLQPALFIGNPPYSDAMRFVERALLLTRGEGTVAFLLRLAWLASQKRVEFHRQHPADLFVLPRRPSFCWSHTYHVECRKCGRKGKIVDRVPVGTPAQALPIVEQRPCPKKGCTTRGLILSHVTTATTDSCDYAWWVWGPGRGGRWQIL